MLLIHPIQELPRALPALLAAFVAGNGSGRGAPVERRRPRHHARSRLLALVHDALPRDRGPRRGQLGLLPAPRARRVARPDPHGRRHRPRDAPAPRARPRRDRHRALGPRARAAACGSTASPRPRPPRCARSCCTAARQAPPRRRRAAEPPARGREEPETELARLDPQLGPLRALHALGPRLGRRGARLPRSTSPTRRTSIPSARARSRQLADRLDRAPVALDRRGARWSLALVAVVVASTVGYALAFWDFRLTAPPRRDPARDARAHHHPRDDDRGAPAARRRDQRAAAAAHGRGRAPDRHRHRPARRPRSRARRLAARAARSARRGAARGRRGHRPRGRR